MGLTHRLIHEIQTTGPITVADFMSRCLFDPLHGYYATRPALGADGDFITAPLVSQMFGEMLAVWAIQAWRDLGEPARFTLCEAGPGDGTLMVDLLRAARVAPAFLAAAQVRLVEPSAPLRHRQAERLKDHHPDLEWVRGMADLFGRGPVLIIANEVLDCLPARQFVRLEDGWAERRVGVRDGRLVFGLEAAAGFVAPDLEVQPGKVVEQSAAQARFATEVAETVARRGGHALLIDYGRDRPEAGDTLQALKRHQKVDVLETAGQADLTVWADFPAVAEAAAEAGARPSPIIPQGALLRALGIEMRAARLAQSRPDHAQAIHSQLQRLIDPEEMGVLFKALCLSHPKAPPPPGFPNP